MEDILTTSNSFSKEEMASFARHMIVFEIERMQNLKLNIDTFIEDTGKSQDAIKVEIQELFDEMSVSWLKLGPARVLARRLYPHLTTLFDILDKALNVQDALEDMRAGRNFRNDEICKLPCCKKVLKQPLETNSQLV